MKTSSETSGTAASETASISANSALVRCALVGIFLLAFVYALYFARDFFMPVLLAFLLALMLTPVVRALGKRGVPAAVSATLLVALSSSGIATTGYLLSGPVVQLVTDAPSIGREVTQRLSEIRKPFDHLLSITQQVEHITSAAQEPGIQKVVLAQPGIISRAAGSLVSAGTSIAIIFVLSLFLLASGTMFYEKIIQSFARLSEKKRALRLVYDVEREISRYLLTVALINGGARVRRWAGPMGDRRTRSPGLGRRCRASQLPSLYRSGSHCARGSGDIALLLRQPRLFAACPRFRHLVQHRRGAARHASGCGAAA